MLIRLLVPINFEQYTVNAIRYCMLLAQKFEAEITLFHAFTPILNEDKDELLTDKDLIATLDEAFKKVKEVKEDALQKFNSERIRIKTKILEGYPEDVIPKYCKEYSPDVVIMGTKSKGETIKELLGSVTLDVINKVSNPVLVVPKDYSLNLDKLNNVLFLTDFSEGEYTSLHKLVRLIMSFDTLIHNVEYCAGGKEKADVNLLTEYGEYCKSTYRNQNMECEYIYGENEFCAANEYIQKRDIDLVALTRRKRSVISKLLQPSRTKKMLFNIDIPMLFFHQ